MNEPKSPTWKAVAQDGGHLETSRLRVEGGYLYREVGYPENPETGNVSWIPSSVALCFVPDQK